MTTPTTDPPWLFQWVVTAALALMGAVVGFLFRRIDQTKQDAEKAATRVRDELLRAAEEAREDVAARHTTNQDNFDKLWAEIGANRTAAAGRHDRMDDKLSRVIELIGEKPSRDDVRADIAALKTDLATMLGRRAGA